MTAAEAIRIAKRGERRIAARRHEVRRITDDLARRLAGADEVKAENKRLRGIIAALWRSLDTYKEPPSAYRDRMKGEVR